MTTRIKDANQVEQAVQSILDRLDLPDDDRTLARLLRAVSDARGIPVELRPISNPDQHHTGYWIEHDGYGVIMYRPTDTRSIQLHTILHECIHAVGEHCGCSARPETVDQLRAAAADPILSIRARPVLKDYLKDDEQAEEVIAERGAFALARWLRGTGSTAAAEIF